jgi:hypothetical protein
VKHSISISVSLLALMAACLAISACGGPANPLGDIPFTATQPPGGTGSQPGDGGGTSDGSADGPIVLSMEAGRYAYPTGRCEIVDDVVYVRGFAPDMRGAFQATLPAWDRELAYLQRAGLVSATHAGQSAADTFELYASRSTEGTTWEWTVSGDDVEVSARMMNRTTATGDADVPEFRDVVIDIQCAGGLFGAGAETAPWAQEEFVRVEPTWVRVPGNVTIELEGKKYPITYLSTCDFFQQSVTAEGIANDASVWLYSEDRGVHLDLFVGDRRAEEEGVRWSLPADASLREDFPFVGSDTIRSWSGEIVSVDGKEAQATITVECTEGDAFMPAGSASVVLDGVTHVLDEVMACTIEGTTIDFFGRSSESGVAIVVSGGGSQILLGDEAGSQSLTPNVAFEVAGRRATWTGTLAGNRQATLVLECG